MKSTGIREAFFRCSIVLSCCFATVSCIKAQDYDVLIRNGTVVDGTGVARYKADVAIVGDRIALIGKISDSATARKVIDASDLIVSPGFVDPHSHAAPGIESSELAAAAPLLYQGVTTAFLNPDGFGPADLRTQIARLTELVPGVNVAPMIGHNAVRSEVMGSDKRPPTEKEQQKMEALVRSGFEVGAFGLSSGLYYEPGKYASTEEIIGLARVASTFPGSFHSSHIRDESNYNVTVLGAIQELIEISRKSGIPGIVSHMKMLGPPVWGKSDEAINMINAARAEGIEIWADQYPYAASGTGLKYALVPGWAQAGGESAMLSRLSDPEQRAKIRDEMAFNLERRAGPNAILIRGYSEVPDYVGMRLDEIAQLRNEDPIDTAIHMLLSGGAPIISFNMNEQDIEAIMRQAWTMTSSDGSVSAAGKKLGHPRSYGAFPRKIRRYVVEREVLTLEQAIHSSSGLTAEVLGLADRGVIRQGAIADILVFDPENLRDTATYSDPSVLATGLDYVLVNGQIAIDHGELSSERFGRVLLRSNNPDEQANYH